MVGTIKGLLPCPENGSKNRVFTEKKENRVKEKKKDKKENREEKRGN